MRGLLWFLGLCFLAVAAALLAYSNNGVVFVILPPWQLEFSLNFLIVVLLFGFGLAYVLTQGLLFTLRLPARARVWRRERQRQQARELLAESIRLFFEGRFGHAMAKAEAAWRQGQTPGVAALVAARAAQRLHEAEKMQLWQERARAAMPKAAATILIDVESALDAGDTTRALAALAELQRQDGRRIAALRLELRARQLAGDAAGVLKLTRQLEKRGGMPAEVAAAIRRKAHADELARLADDPERLLACFRTLPAEANNPALTRTVAATLHRAGRDAAAAELIEQALDQGEWSSELADLYGRLGVGEVGPMSPEGLKNLSRQLTARIARADAWLARHPDDSRLLLTLGRLCERQKLWGKAIAYLEASLALKPSREGYLTLARLQDALEQPEVANRLFRQAAECES